MNILILKANNHRNELTIWAREQLKKLSKKREELSKTSVTIKECTLEALNHNTLCSADFVIIFGFDTTRAEKVINSLALISKFGNHDAYLTDEEAQKVASKIIILHYSSPAQKVRDDDNDRMYEGSLWLYSSYQPDAEYFVEYLLNFKHPDSYRVDNFLK